MTPFMTRRRLLASGALLSAAGFLSACAPEKDVDAAPQQERDRSDDRWLVASNADEEAQDAMKAALRETPDLGSARIQGFGTSELAGKLLLLGPKLDVDVVTLSEPYLRSFEARARKEGRALFLTLPPAREAVLDPTTPATMAPLTALSGAILLNEALLAEEGLPRPSSLIDLARPVYRSWLSIPRLEGSTTGWLLALGLAAAVGEREAFRILAEIEANATPHLEMSGSGPLKKIRAGECAVGFGLRHQAAADRAKGLPIGWTDPEEGTFSMVESAVALDKGADTRAGAAAFARALVECSRPKILEAYPTPLYHGERVPDELRPPRPQRYPEPLTLELLERHKRLLAEARAARRG